MSTQKVPRMSINDLIAVANHVSKNVEEFSKISTNESQRRLEQFCGRKMSWLTCKRILDSCGVVPNKGSRTSKTGVASRVLAREIMAVNKELGLAINPDLLAIVNGKKVTGHEE